MKRTSNLILLVIIICATFGLFVFDCYGARPLSTNDAGTVERGHFEVECGYEYAKGDADEENSLSFAVTCGIAQNLDLGVEVPYRFIDFDEGDDVDGIGDVEFTTKYTLVKETEDHPAFAMSFGVKSETGDETKGLGTGEIDYSINGILTKKINKITTHLNCGYTFVGEPDGEDVDDLMSYAVAVEYPLGEKLNILGEIAGETDFNGNFDNNACSGLFGINHCLNEDIVIDYGFGFGISDASPDYTITSGMTIYF